MDSSDWLTLCGLLGAGAAFAIGLAQYILAQRWKRAEFVASEIKAFEADTAIRRVMWMLDYVDRSIDFGLAGPVTVTDQLLAAALTVHDDRPDGYGPEEIAIRDAFDHFLGRLELFDHFIDSRLISFTEIERYLYYWIRLMAGVGSGRRSATVIENLWAFIDFYTYEGVRCLAARFEFGISAPPAP